ncbi:MAG: 50S ribosomal protein L4 [Euryarchaeota archaeon]|nr:50S ribosomal protein L4 [Euryarchaeota archaeon]
MVSVYSLDGSVKGEVELPAVFSAPFRPDLIKRAVIAQQSHRLQPYGTDRMAGKRTSAESWGPGHGVSRVPRVKGSRHPAAGRAAFVPQAVGGRRAHPPKVEKVIYEKINRKERIKAIASAIAATASPELVRSRGHVFEVEALPIVVEDAFEELSKAKDVLSVFSALGIADDIDRAERRKIRAGKGKMRGRRHRCGKSVLIVVAQDRGVGRGARNLPGVDVVPARELSAEHLAPGAHPGRLAVYTESSLNVLAERFEPWALR